MEHNIPRRFHAPGNGGGDVNVMYGVLDLLHWNRPIFLNLSLIHISQEKGSLSINSENIFPIIKKWLYSDQDIFIRELISNGVDAIAKLRKLASLGEATVEENPEYRVDVVLNPEDKLITITDNGIGMTDEEVKKYINQIAFSGAAEFMEKYKESSEDPIIGHFGLGFYSAFMVSTLVEIDTLSHQQGATPVHWSCDCLLYTSRCV